MKSPHPFSVEEVVQDFRDACDASFRPAETLVGHAEILAGDMRRLEEQCRSKLQTMEEGSGPTSVVVHLAADTLREQRMTESRLKDQLDQLSGTAARCAERFQEHARCQRSLAMPAGVASQAAQRATTALIGVASRVEAVHNVTVEVFNAVAAAVDRLRALTRRQG